MSNSEKGGKSEYEHRFTDADNDAYEDLLNSFFGPEPKRENKPAPNITEGKGTGKTSSAQSRTSQTKTAGVTGKSSASHKGEFKLNIKDLDSEFNTAGKTEKAEKPKKTGVPREQLYKKANPEKKKARDIAESERKVEKSEPKKDKPADTIDFMPAFSYDSPERKTPSEVKPVYYKPIFDDEAQPSAEQRQVADKRNKNAAASRKNASGGNGYSGSAVIIKKNEQPARNKFAAFFIKNKKAWITIAACIAVSVLISVYAISCMNDVLAINRDSETVITVNLPADSDTNGAIDVLKDSGLIKHKLFCRVFASFMSYRDDNYLTGIYYFTESMGLENMLSAFKESPDTGETVTLTFPEGYTVDQIAEKLEKYEVCTATEFYAAMSDVDFSSEYSFISEEDNKELRYRLLEGYLYPDTYEFYIGENASSVIRKFLDNFKEKWTDEYAAQAEKLGMTVDEVITLASIIEKEAYGADQMPLVSSVLHNRLNKSGLYPTLQCDSTTAYFNDYIAKNVTDSASLAKYTQNYSTYKCEGLPVGAICNPGDDSINSALYPSETSYYFFAHDNNKKLYLAETDAQQESNKYAILKANQSSDD